MMEFVNFFTRCEKRPREAMKTFLILLSPYAPHLCEELWLALGGNGCVSMASWPTWDADAIAESAIEIPVQVNGKVKAKISVPAGLDEADLTAAALADKRVQLALDGKSIVKQIVVPGRMVNFVVKG
jgi:leucyl-tRNA synthetase